MLARHNSRATLVTKGKQLSIMIEIFQYVVHLTTLVMVFRRDRNGERETEGGRSKDSRKKVSLGVTPTKKKLCAKGHPNRFRNVREKGVQTSRQTFP